MNLKIPVVTPKDLIKALKKISFYKFRQRGIHLTPIRDSDDKQVTVPVHPGKTMGKGLLNKILKEVAFAIEEFKRLE